MLAMTDGFCLDNIFWDDHSWSFPILLSDENTVKTSHEIGGEIETKREVPLPPSQSLMFPQPPPPPPPTSPVAKGKKRGGGEGDQGLHIWTERERRKRMRNMFTDLHALIPHLPPRADKTTIVDEAVLLIKKLELTLSNLEKQKKERLLGCDPQILSASASSKPPNPVRFKTWSSQNLVLNVIGKDAHISICCRNNTSLLTSISYIMEKYKLSLVTAHVTPHPCGRMYMIHVRVNGDRAEALFFVEEIYKQAVAEIMLRIRSYN